MGVNTGPVVAGSIGGAGRLNFSVIGDPVNVAARVEAATREIDEDVLITEATRRELSSSIEIKACGEHELKGLGAAAGALCAADRRAGAGARRRGAAAGSPGRRAEG